MSRHQYILNSFGLSSLKPLMFNGFQNPQLYLSEAGKRAVGQLYRSDDPYADNEFKTIGGEQALNSYLGTPVFSDLILSDKDGNNSLVLTTVLMDASQRKNLVRTTVQGRKGTVKESISLDDYFITFRGMIVHDHAWTYPREDVATLKGLLELSKELKVTCEYLQMFSIYNIAVEGYEFPQREGFQNTQLFQITAYSDEPIELRVEE